MYARLIQAEIDPPKHGPIFMASSGCLSSSEFADRVRATDPLAKDGFYVIVRDWLAEMTMMMHRTGKLRNKKQMPEARSFEEMLNYAMFAGDFMNSLTPAIKDVATRGIKVCANVGASDTKLLAQLADKTCKEAGQPLKVAWIEGNDVTGTVESMLNKGEGFNSHAQHTLLAQGRHINMGLPACAIDYKGEGAMYKEKNTDGCLTVASVTSQLLYEIQGPLYYNCDVTADLETSKSSRWEIGQDRVKASGVTGLPPPPTTRVGITGFAGRTAHPRSTPETKTSPRSTSSSLCSPATANCLARAIRAASSASEGFKNGKKIINIPLAPSFRKYPRQQPSYETAWPVPLEHFSPTTRLPLASLPSVARAINAQT
ncbi:DUF1446-domain-containing protein [Stemphylium lycopersici]|nr:DUF1446-domain-containing protein [Stemphylium lycopersici]